ncbi:hypothetical protein PTSG_05942 [Salpingoeca rosetta]|uniref:Uncharacterized protein n=1 Tax=Salpingoeca rosetta (strain ATCC 50818 / BSB-021) TaxID=946362 RepID=F2UD82_SALR5|nr:uncharacterized protein PTSG_05942 [Salpingoeca rosetta]EGD74577.1 hypothetical protein PTSG_05942 [Salpingoeca rosetta]|eukprot:XP_004992834.1 hypothetical protein PTSG_05942 [Salpingoeca rosetta]
MDVAEEDVAGWDEAMFVHKPDNLLRCPICLLGIRDASMCPSPVSVAPSPSNADAEIKRW